MADNTPSDNALKQQTGVQQRFQDIRRDIETAHSRRELTALYTRARYPLRLTHARSWEAQFGHEVIELRRVAQEAFVTTVRQINRRATQLGISADYDKRWERVQ